MVRIDSIREALGTGEKSKMIEFLLWRKFPDCFNSRTVLTKPGFDRNWFKRDQCSQRYKQLLKYELELLDLPKMEFLDIYELEKEIFNKEDEKGRSYNQPDATADFSQWSKMELWTLDEAIALVLGKNPKKVRWCFIEEYVGISGFVSEYDKLRELALRKKEIKDLDNKIAPIEFLTWAKEMGVDVPKELIGQVEKRIEGSKKSEHEDNPEPLAKTWVGVTIKLLTNNRISFECGEKQKHTKERRVYNLYDLGLENKRTHKRNASGKLLLKLAEGIKQPISAKTTESDRQAMKALKKALIAVTGIKESPFSSTNFKADGWKPQFTLEDHRRAAAERAKGKGVGKHSSEYQSELDRKQHKEWEDSKDEGEAPDYEDENDPNGAWLRERGG